MTQMNPDLLVRGGRIGTLIDLFERNYRLIERLVPELDLPFVSAISRAEHDLPLHLIVLERGKFTASFRLSYQIEGRFEPDVWVKLYRDAQLAETLYCATRPPWLALDESDPEALRYLNAQWKRNVMLNKWLHYLLHHGHGFGMASRPRVLTGSSP